MADNVFMEELLLKSILFPSLQKLYKGDYYNIYHNVSERNICARLAFHIECTMREYSETGNSFSFEAYHADVEYNRTTQGRPLTIRDDEQRIHRIVCDLLIHDRGGDNLMAIELKKDSNKTNIDSDRKRLESFVTTDWNRTSTMDNKQYVIGVFILYSKDRCVVEIYNNEDGKGKKTNEIQISRYQLNPEMTYMSERCSYVKHHNRGL